MQTFETVAEAGTDRVLHIDIPVAGAGSRYHVIVVLTEDLVGEERSTFPDQWPDQFFEKTAGAWQGDFERPEHDDLEVREDF
ncbi:MAG: hypothetical protein JWM11_5446 [Planctomycetaceae bacterium]|nr:hypothetical protein [Planctomycetaceae bacterium]